ncbi:MAG: hypothetical protein NXI19_01840 [Alphaproteobacteria bacterium]|jgi:hypothetical protein|nr:hypothetical protein [Alphaproteobacteria bacterium]
MDTKHQQKIILRQSKLMVFTRAASPFFQCRIKLSAKPYVYKSLNTVDEAEARQLGEDLYAEAKFNAESGMSICSASLLREVFSDHRMAFQQ